MKEKDIRNVKTLDELVEISMEDASNLFDFKKFVETPCPFCKNTEKKIEFNKQGFQYVSCSRCASLFVCPRPPQDQLDLFYSIGKSGEFFASKFLQPYMEKRREYVFKPRAQTVIEQFNKLLDREGIIGDIGAGNGIFLEELERLSPEMRLIAIEPSNAMVEILKKKGFETIPEMLEKVGEEWNGYFDMLCSFELFEHLFDPQRFLIKIRDLLKPGGILYMTTLSSAGFDIKVLWDKHNSVSPPQHLNFGNPMAMELLFKRCGYEIISITTPGKLDWDIVEQRARNDQISLDRFFESLINADEKIKESFQLWLQDNNLSSHICVIAKKI